MFAQREHSNDIPVPAAADLPSRPTDLQAPHTSRKYDLLVSFGNERVSPCE
jgi:hypothetical protein